ncbi:hypothetical protein D4R75_15965 [bacterium]|nr:MAG: hypothetical protein D4R75_15965 [bacterium]
MAITLSNYKNSYIEVALVCSPDCEKFSISTSVVLQLSIQTKFLTLRQASQGMQSEYGQQFTLVSISERSARTQATNPYL